MGVGGGVCGGILVPDDIWRLILQLRGEAMHADHVRLSCALQRRRARAGFLKAYNYLPREMQQEIVEKWRLRMFEDFVYLRGERA